MEMESVVAEARRRGRDIAVFVGLLLFALGLLLVFLSLLCSNFPAVGPCWRFQDDTLHWMGYVGVLFFLLFCCAPCFALSEDEMRRWVPFYKEVRERKAFTGLLEKRP